MRVAVIGATGVLGRTLLPLLNQSGHDIHALAPSPEKARSLFGRDVKVYTCDLLSDHAEQQLLKGLHGCDTIMHIATAIPRDFSIPNAWEANNRIRKGGVRLALNVSLQLGVKRYLQQSITMAYPDCGQQWIYENTPLDTSPERAEICAAVIAMEYMLKEIPLEKLHWCILRGGEFVGPGTFQELTINNLKEGREVIPGDGQRYLSLINVEDMAMAFVAALDKAEPGSIFNIVDHPVQQGSYFEQLAEQTGSAKPKYDTTARPQPSWRCSNQAAMESLEWKPQKGIFPEK